MATRKRIAPNRKEDNDGGIYFDPPDAPRDFFSSGCTVLDCVLGGGWPEGKMVNIIGDSSSGKSLLAIEASANFLRKYDEGKVVYVETEAAFDPQYAESLGIPVNRIDLVTDIYTVEDLHKHIEECLKKSEKDSKPVLYIIDSLDALSDEAELESDMEKGSYGTKKARLLSQMFRRTHAKLSRANVTMLVVSQTRENIGVTFGDRFTRSGGKALKFYATIELWLSHTGRIERTVDGVKKVTGVKIRARTKKNRMAAPFQECDFTIMFNYGTDSVKASIEWLETTKKLGIIGIEGDSKKILREVNKMEDSEYESFCTMLDERVREAWKELHDKFKPVRRKY